MHRDRARAAPNQPLPAIVATDPARDAAMRSAVVGTVGLARRGSSRPGRSADRLVDVIDRDRRAGGCWLWWRPSPAGEAAPSGGYSERRAARLGRFAMRPIDPAALRLCRSVVGTRRGWSRGGRDHRRRVEVCGSPVTARMRRVRRHDVLDASRRLAVRGWPVPRVGGGRVCVWGFRVWRSLGRYFR